MDRVGGKQSSGQSSSFFSAWASLLSCRLFCYLALAFAWDTELERVKVSTGVQILVSGLAFAVIHTGFDVVGILLTFVLGIGMATAYVIGKRSLTSSIFSHALINILIEPWLLLFVIQMYSRLG